MKPLKFSKKLERVHSFLTPKAFAKQRESNEALKYVAYGSFREEAVYHMNMILQYYDQDCEVLLDKRNDGSDEIQKHYYIRIDNCLLDVPANRLYLDWTYENKIWRCSIPVNDLKLGYLYNKDDGV